jgi:hypothetical protein
MNEEAAAQAYLIDYLGSDSTLSDLGVNSVWLSSVPQSESLPVVKIDRQESGDVMAVGLHRVLNSLAFLIRGIVHWTGSGAIDYSEVNAIGDRLDALLHDHEASTSTLQVAIYREESWTSETIEGGDTFLHCGGIFRVQAHAL